MLPSRSSVCLPELDARHGVGDLAGDELDAAQRRLVVEQDAARRMHAVAFAIIDRAPVAEELGHAVRAARMKGRGLVLRVGLHQAEHLARRRLVEPDRGLDPPQRLEHVDDADAVHLGGDLGLRPRGPDETLRRQVVDFVRTCGFDRAAERRHVGQVAVHKRDCPARCPVRATASSTRSPAAPRNP